MSKAGKRILEGLKEVRAALSGDPEAISKIRVTPSCGCVFCDLLLPVEADGCHRGPKGEVIECPLQ
jgi:hypothetical protein